MQKLSPLFLITTTVLSAVLLFGEVQARGGPPPGVGGGNGGGGGGGGGDSASGSGTCNTTDVQITAAWLADDGDKSNILTGGPINALSCVGSFNGNDQPQPSTNLGWLNDGWANGQEWDGGGPNAETFEGDLFIGQVDEYYDEGENEGKPTGDTIDSGLELQALKDPENKVDPGWITVGKYEACDDANCTGEFLSPESQDFSDEPDESVEYKNSEGEVVRLIGDDSTDEGGIQTFFSCTGCDNDAETGKWSLTPDSGIPERFDAVSGQDDKSFFDAFSLVLKGGNYYTAYLFTAAQLGITDLSDVYNFSGEFDMPIIGGNQSGLSHLTVLAHDPTSNGTTTTAVPEPNVLWLMGLGLIGLVGFTRINAARRSSTGKAIATQQIA